MKRVATLFLTEFMHFFQIISNYCHQKLVKTTGEFIIWPKFATYNQKFDKNGKKSQLNRFLPPKMGNI